MTAKLTPEEHQFPDVKTGTIQAFCMHGLPVLCKTCWADRAAAIEGRWEETERYRKALEEIGKSLSLPLENNGKDWEQQYWERIKATRVKVDAALLKT